MNTSDCPHDHSDEISGSQSQQKHCQFCGRFFRPDIRVGERQIACARDECRRLRRRKAQREWVAKNPGYYCGRSAETTAWRLANPGYQAARRRRLVELQDEIPCNSSIITIHLAITDKTLKVELQDEIRRQKSLGHGFIVAGRGRELQDEIAQQTLSAHIPP